MNAAAIFSAALAMTMILAAFMGCVDPSHSAHTDPTAAPTEAPTEEPVEITTDEPTDEPTEIPTDEPTEVPTDEPTEAPTAAPTATAKATATPKPTAAPTATPRPTSSTSDFTEPPHESKPDPDKEPELNSKSGKYSFYQEGSALFKVDNRAFEMAYYVKNTGKKYADLVSWAAAELKGETNVYSLIIPTNYGVVLPDDIRAKISGYVDTEKSIETEYSMMSDDVLTVSCTHDMRLHRDEYLYFRTDHHWTALGAYYAYRAFCRVKGVSEIPLSDRQEVEIKGFYGSSYKLSNYDPDLEPADTIYAYYPVSKNAKLTLHTADGKTHNNWPIVNKVRSYDAFAGSDNPLNVFTNPDVTDGSTLIIIKESFGNALLPFLVDHYSTIYEIDYRYWSGNVIDLAREIGATDLVFANNFTVLSAGSKIGQIAKIVK